MENGRIQRDKFCHGVGNRRTRYRLAFLLVQPYYLADLAIAHDEAVHNAGHPAFDDLVVTSRPNTGGPLGTFLGNPRNPFHVFARTEAMRVAPARPARLRRMFIDEPRLNQPGCFIRRGMV